ncbi:phosphate propanoyltransferase [Faecalicatena acetigenes]|uniref:Phosphate propanoyltransferase n=1 Tax=Faecalicatena acetigenes TaxID=2981790 RepID=A0ABT2TC35_9FIRM|nr:MULTISPECIES: phosphate propanoyltransferase [Lachnospiraceae]MCU6747279.1 phosphate propanoyltransferase [Faecalicatena acetigenes]RGT72056.1 phosphate propanoyltransferase [Ruminococcus sp. AF18-22]SCH77531.1 Phosphate propanoyltransferase [uncultured Clostridium sp.]
MNLKIPIETSARHIHLSQQDFEILFGPGSRPTFFRELSQPGQYACKERLTVVGPKGRFEKVIVLGPCRSHTQVEISVTDARRLGIPSVIRQSGDLDDTPGCLLIGPSGKVQLEKGVIVAKRHIHMTPVDAIRAHVKDNDIVFVITTSYERSLIFSDVVVRVDPSFSLAMHVDTDEANAFANEDHPTGVILKLFNGHTYSLQTWADELQAGIDR